MATQVDEDKEKDDLQSQEMVPTPTPQVQEQVEQNVPPQAQVIHDPPKQASTHVPLVKHGRISKDHPIDQIIGSPSKGVRTRSKHASFCEHYSFVSCIEPTSIEEALEDSDWVMAMQEELNNFTRNEVWVLEAPPKNKNIIGTKWVFRNKQDEHGVVVRNKARLVAKGSLKSKVWILVKLLLRLQDLKLSASFLLTLLIKISNISNGCEKCILKWRY